MGIRGQGPEAWVARFRQGNCPIHGLGLVAANDAVDGADGVDVRCTHEECAFLARRFPGRDRHHHRFGWSDGPDDVRAALRKANVIGDDGRPTRFAADTRTSYPLEDEG
jgi:hypothetical protein